jgi:hypothetical protein
VAADFLEAEDAFVEIDAFFKIVQAVTGVEEFASDRLHKATIGLCPQERNKDSLKAGLQRQANLLRWGKGLSSK